MSAITIRDLPDAVHASLRRLAADRHVSVEALARDALADIAQQAPAGGIDFAKLAGDRTNLGLMHDGPLWTKA